jgi:hypothetical protein
VICSMGCGLKLQFRDREVGAPRPRGVCCCASRGLVGALQISGCWWWRAREGQRPACLPGCVYACGGVYACEAYVLCACAVAQAHELMECCMLPTPCKYKCGAQPPFIKLVEHELNCNRRWLRGATLPFVVGLHRPPSV